MLVPAVFAVFTKMNWCSCEMIIGLFYEANGLDRLLQGTDECRGPL
jgi:hypothetical protein